MTKLVYFRLALNNLWKNRKTYLPFLLASTLLTFTMYSFLMITFNPGLNQMHGGMVFITVLDFGIGVVGLFTAIFLFYANSFLIKRRKKEMGLYAILGMEKKHIGRVLFHELSMTWVLSMAIGLGLGILLTRLMFLLIRLVIRVDVPLVGTVSATALWSTLILFALLFFLLIVYNSWQVRSVNPIDLLRGGQTGEREPKARWILAVLGLIFMGAGYWLAQVVNNPMEAIALFFVAVILVIIGTYLLFLTGSIALLKLLKNNKHFYYRAKHFISVSGLLYRMKQNAAGLASIAILCTMAMITVGTTVALYNGSEKMLDSYYPNDVQITLKTPEDQAAFANDNTAFAAKAGVTITSYKAFSAYEATFSYDNGAVGSLDEARNSNLGSFDRMHYALIFSTDSFNTLEGSAITLNANEIACYTDSKDMQDSLSVGGQTYTLRKIDALPFTPTFSTGSSYNNVYLVVPSDAVAQAILADANTSDKEKLLLYTSQWNIQGTEQQQDAYNALLKDSDWSTNNSLRIKSGFRSEWYILYGGFLFVGIFLGLIFLMGTAMILYFKQISEGYQDHDRFIILQQVGMSPEEVRGTVRRQILMVFFLPLLVAVCHVAGSLHMITLMLQLFGLVDVPYIALNTFLSALGVIVLYGLFYLKTTGTYYKLVRFDSASGAK